MASLLQVLCANEKCVHVVDIRPNAPGRPKKYCSFRCGQQQRSREYYRRQTGPGAVDSEPDSLYPHIQRVMPRTVKKAYDLRITHLHDCPNALPEDNGKCPSYWDERCTQRLCLIYAVMADDWDHLRRISKGLEPGERSMTTEDGYWKDQRPPTREEIQARLDRAAGEVGVPPGSLTWRETDPEDIARALLEP